MKTMIGIPNPMSSYERISHMFDVYAWISNNLHVIIGVPLERLEYESWDIVEIDKYYLEVVLTDGRVKLYDAKKIAIAMEEQKNGNSES